MGWVNSIRERVRSGAQPPGEFVALAHHLHDMRLFKSAAEVKLMRKAQASLPLPISVPWKKSARG